METLNREIAEEYFASNDFSKISRALVAIALNEPDWKWVQEKCLFFFQSNNPDISGLAATCLGHVARIHSQIDKERVIPLLKSRLKDFDIAGSIQDALDDIQMFAK